MVPETELIQPSSIARLPGALTIEEFEHLCEVRNLTSTEITERDVIQTITIRHNVLTGRINIETKKIGEQVIGILADAMACLWKDYFKSPIRPPLTSGHARVMIDLDGDSLKIVYGLTDANNPDLPPIADAPVVDKVVSGAVRIDENIPTLHGRWRCDDVAVYNVV